MHPAFKFYKLIVLQKGKFVHYPKPVFIYFCKTKNKVKITV